MIQISGIFPEMAIQAGHKQPRSELGIGGLMPWAGKLWMVSYIAHIGHGGGLYSLDKKMNLERHPQSVTGTFANRFMHAPTDSIVIGPHVIDGEGKVRTSELLAQYRLAGTCAHLTDPDNKCYVLSMEGPLFELDLNTMRVEEIANLSYELGLFPDRPARGTGKASDAVNWSLPQPHFKACHVSQGRLIVANNTFSEEDYTDGAHAKAGRLAEWDGKAWKIICRTGFNEVAGRLNFGGAAFAVGWDRASAILMVRYQDAWKEYRLPKGSHTYEHCWQTEWPRLREVEHERYMLDANGIFYEMSGLVVNGGVWGIKPVCSHLRVIPDFCAYAGLLVMGDNQVSPTGNHWSVGESQSNLWFGHIDDLWRWGKPTGWGGPWWKSPVAANACSAPYLMTGFDRKTLHVSSLAQASKVRIEIDFHGDGTWCPYQELEVPANGYRHHVFPEGFSAHWCRLISESASTLSAIFHYT